MSLNKLKLNFVDFWPGFNPTTDPVFGKFLQEHYEVEYQVNDPHIAIFSVFGINHKRYSKENVVKIFYTPENFLLHKYPALDGVLGWENVDYYSHGSITSFDRVGKNNHRMPCYVRRYGFDLYDKIENTLPKTISKKDFVYIQSACVEFRDVMVKELMEKFKIDCVGRCLNNTNIKVNDKLEFIKNYNFVISFENSSTVGYSTEKLTDSFVANSIPVYFGDPNVSQDFYEDSFVNYHSFNNKEEIYDRLNDLISSDELKLEMLQNKRVKNKDLFNGRSFVKFIQKYL